MLRALEALTTAAPFPDAGSELGRWAPTPLLSVSAPRSGIPIENRLDSRLFFSLAGESPRADVLPPSTTLAVCDGPFPSPLSSGASLMAVGIHLSGPSPYNSFQECTFIE
ncbi:unnamed protein product [Allacma fusca]|uniref:Uncharacterized protein n=1 Tax=Allacma fusca TaxID=39272 RepID=A0A8J2KXJ1_9HEXA|nr:unnamed protein product [Allacma fusca]